MHPHKDRKIVLMLGCFDTKAEEFGYLHSCLSDFNVEVLAINMGVNGTTHDFHVDIEAEEIASQTEWSLADLRKRADRGLAVETMGRGAAKLIAKLVSEGKINGAIGMGGGGGTFMVLSAMQAIPMGVPKLCLSTVATKDLSRQVGTKDITLMPSVVDIAGLNRISRTLIGQAAGAIIGMINVRHVHHKKTLGIIAISTFGNTTACVEKCSELLQEEGFEVLTFHAVGIGGKTMESLIHDGFFDAVLDITTTELADDLCDGICSAGPNRLTAASKIGIPQVVVPGCMDMVNYGHLDTVPNRFSSRQLHSWAPDVTLMRTNENENRTLGTMMALRLNDSKGKVVILLPLKGISKISGPGGVFHNPKVDQVLFDAIKEHTHDFIRVIEIDATINDELFATQAVKTLLEIIGE